MEILSSKYINVNGSLLDLSVPCVMGILNITPDSFYAGSRMQTEAEITARAQQILDEGAGIIDIGAYSSRRMRRMFLLMKKWNVCVWDWKSCVRHNPEQLFLSILSGGCGTDVCGRIWSGNHQ